MAKQQQQTFADRLTALKGDETYRSLSEKLGQRGIDVSAQTIHKWIHGGGITPENLHQIAGYFGTSAAILFFGTEEATPAAKTNEGQLFAWAWERIPDRVKGQLKEDIARLVVAYASHEDGGPDAGYFQQFKAMIR